MVASRRALLAGVGIGIGALALPFGRSAVA